MRLNKISLKYFQVTLSDSCSAKNESSFLINAFLVRRKSWRKIEGKILCKSAYVNTREEKCSLKCTLSDENIRMFT